jgi:hypothetical protein
VIYSFLEIQPHHYTAMVEDLTGQRSRLTLQISGRDPQGAFNWSCGNRGLKRVGNLEENIEAPQGDEARPMKRITKWSWLDLWQRMTGPSI